MELQDMVKKLYLSTEFKEWVVNHPDFYLAHAFVMQDEQNRGIWQIGYFNDKIDKMITFIMEEDKISITPEQDVMKASQKIVELNPADVKILVADAVKSSDACIKENYSNELVAKSFFIIQHLEGVTIFNITYLTHSFKTINIKIDVTDGKIVKHTIGTLADFS